MMKYFQRLGKSLMIPVAALPIGGLLMGIGYWISSYGPNAFATLLTASGGILIDNMAVLFAVGVAFGMSKDNDGSAALAGLISWLTVTSMLGVGFLTNFLGAEPNVAFGKIQNQFIGILCGVIASICYNKFYKSKLPGFLSFFSGRRSVAIVTVVFSLLACIPLYFIWPVVYNALVAFGKSIIGMGAVGAGIYGFLNRLLIPIGMHHALNSVFWFDVANVNDLARFWGLAEGGVMGQTGMYMAGFFPVMMFGLPAAALAMYTTAKNDKKRKIAAGLLSSAALCSFFIGITEPLEFAFMFLAPVLYLVHAILTGISCFVVALLPTRAGFQFSAGFVDWFLSFKAPFAQSPWILLLVGAVFFAIYFFVFRFIILKMDLKTPGREDDEDAELSVTLTNDNYAEVARIILEGVGGKENVETIDNCITRLRLEVKDRLLVDEKKIKSAGVAGVIRPGKTSVQVVIGTQVQHVADAFKDLCR